MASILHHDLVGSIPPSTPPSPSETGDDLRKKVIVASVAMLRADFKAVLIARRRSDSVRNGGKWELISGKESPEDRNLWFTILRELEEEIGMIVGQHYWDVWQLDRDCPYYDTEDGKYRFLIHRIVAVLKKSSRLALKPERHGHDKVEWLTEQRFLELASPDPDRESGNFVPNLEPYLRRVFAACAVRGVILDALTSGVDVEVLPLVLSEGGGNVLMSKRDHVLSSCHLAPGQHINDVLRDAIPDKAKLPFAQALLKLELSQNRHTRDVRAKMAMVLQAEGYGLSSSVPSDMHWVEISSENFHTKVKAVQGFQRRTLQSLQTRALRKRPPWSEWLGHHMRSVHNSTRSSSGSLKALR
ncbi:MAG: NUDIX domain-containing protein [Candidatus Abawacabacteria bacterium]|nr:NUDIX domain-containing protein [Candidatus Abawacabacteria bacterium]